MSMERAQRIRETMGTAGWQDIAATLDDLINETETEFKALLARSPEKINLKVAQKYAVRAKAFEDFRESLRDSLKPLENGPQPGFRAGKTIGAA